MSPKKSEIPGELVSARDVQARAKNKILQTKWTSLKARGITPPASVKERAKRLKEAHGR